MATRLGGPVDHGVKFDGGVDQRIKENTSL